jgi:hypothetical protein
MNGHTALTGSVIARRIMMDHDGQGFVYGIIIAHSTSAAPAISTQGCHRGEISHSEFNAQD